MAFTAVEVSIRSSFHIARHYHKTSPLHHSSLVHYVPSLSHQNAYGLCKCFIGLRRAEISNVDPEAWLSPARSATLVTIRWNPFHAIHTRDLGTHIRPVAEVKHQARSKVEQLRVPSSIGQKVESIRNDLFIVAGIVPEAHYQSWKAH